METYIPQALFILFQLCLFVQLYFLVARHSKLMRYRPDDALPDVNTPISVIVSARNESANLRNNLPLLLTQNYPDYEVVVINDCSFDDSEEVLKELSAKYQHLKVVTVAENDRFRTGKKFAITMGIKAAKNECLLFTDADCWPSSDHWIARMAAHFNGSNEIVLGYSPYDKTGNALNSFIRFETIKTAVNYLSSALMGDAYMGIGRNMAYTKSLFFRNKGFASHMHILSGDDDIFVNQNATRNNTAIEIHHEAFIFSEPKTSLGSYFRQKRRHMGAGKMYKASHRRMLSIDAISGFLFYVLFFVCLIFKFETLLTLGVFIFRWILQLIIYRNIFKQLDGKQLLWTLPFFDLIYYIYLNVFGLIGTFTKTRAWK